MTADAGSAAHWDGAYDLGDTTRSWFQDRPNQSLRMFEAAGVCSADSVIDVGGGASTLVDALLARGFADVTVLDISAAGLDAARQRVGVRAGRVDWVLTDLLTWQPPRNSSPSPAICNEVSKPETSTAATNEPTLIANRTGHSERLRPTIDGRIAHAELGGTASPGVLAVIVTERGAGPCEWGIPDASAAARS